ncbi:MAG: hypothetical protein NUV81_00140 [bacterium]|nr:hypothetical protein [bacterium]
MSKESFSSIPNQKQTSSLERSRKIEAFTARLKKDSTSTLVQIALHLAGKPSTLPEDRMKSIDALSQSDRQLFQWSVKEMLRVIKQKAEPKKLRIDISGS